MSITEIIARMIIQIAIVIVVFMVILPWLMDRWFASRERRERRR